MKTNSSYRFGEFHVGTPDMWGNYCPETKEYYLAVYDDRQQEKVIAVCWYDEHGYCHMYSCRGYDYEVVRELLRLGHLTPKTLEQFQQAGGRVWWDQP